MNTFRSTKTSISGSEADIQQVINKLNLRLRKCLGWKTPYEVYFKKSLQFGLTIQGVKNSFLNSSVTLLLNLDV